MLVGKPYRHYNMPKPKIKARVEALLQPELLQSHLSAPFHLSLVFSALLRLQLYCTLSTAMLKFYLHAERPVSPKVIPKEYDYVR